MEPPSVGQGAAFENLVGDIRLYSCTPSSRCHCSQWLLRLRAEGVNRVWFIGADRGPSVLSRVFVFVSRSPLDPMKGPSPYSKAPFFSKKGRKILSHLESQSKLFSVTGRVGLEWINRWVSPSKVWWGT